MSSSKGLGFYHTLGLGHEATWSRGHVALGLTRARSRVRVLALNEAIYSFVLVFKCTFHYTQGIEKILVHLCGEGYIPSYHGIYHCIEHPSFKQHQRRVSPALTAWCETAIG